MYPVPKAYTLKALNATQNIELASTGGTTSCSVQVVNQYYNAKTNNKNIDSSLFDYTSSNESVATVNEVGLVTATTDGIA